MKGESRREHNPVKSMSEEAATLASSLAPLEEQEGGEQSRHPNGAIVLDTGKLELPKGFIEEDKGEDSFGLDRVIVFILALALAFIAFIAYLISIEPSR
jgi:hypothetical protein